MRLTFGLLLFHLTHNYICTGSQKEQFEVVTTCSHKKISFNKLTLCFVQFYNSNFAVSDKTIHHYPNYVIAYEGGQVKYFMLPEARHVKVVARGVC